MNASRPGKTHPGWTESPNASACCAALLANPLRRQRLVPEARTFEKSQMVAPRFRRRGSPARSAITLPGAASTRRASRSRQLPAAVVLDADPDRFPRLEDFLTELHARCLELPLPEGGQDVVGWKRDGKADAVALMSKPTLTARAGNDDYTADDNYTVGMLPLINPVERAESFDHADWVFETKFNGFRAAADAVRGRRASRNGNWIQRFEAVHDGRRVEGMQIDA